MTREERSILETLDRVVQSEEMRVQIAPIVERVRADLRRKSNALMTWEPIPLTIFGDALPKGIRSAWIFVLRAGANTGAERHPNSHQRMMTLEGRGDLRTQEEFRIADRGLRKEQWKSNVLASDRNAPLERRWISIPKNAWHEPVVGKDADWVVISFHTVPAEELIEEKPDSSGGKGTRQKRYVEGE